MALALFNNSETAQTNGTAVTHANSGGAAGAAWDLVTTGTGASVVYSTGTPIQGALSYLFTVGATGANAKVSWQSTGVLGGTFSRLQGMFNIQPGASSTAAQIPIARFTAGGTQCARFSLNTDNTLSLHNTSSGNITAANSVGTWTSSSKWLVKFDITFGASGSGTIEVWYNGTGAGTVDETLTFSAANLFSSAVDTVEFGITATESNFSVKMDNLYVTDQGIPSGPLVAGTATVGLGGLTATSAGNQTGRGTAHAAFGGLTAAGVGTVRAVVSGTAAAALGALAATAAGTKNSSTVMGVATAHFGSLTAAGVSPVKVFGVATATLGGLSASAVIPMPVFFFTPPQRIMTVMIRGSLRAKFPVSQTVWKDADGVWQHEETPSQDVLNEASLLLAVSGRPQVVSEEIADELIAAGIGTITIT